MKLLLVIAALAAVAVAIPIGNNEEFASIPMSQINLERTSGRNVQLFNGSYFPKLDHFRPQDNRLAHFHYHINIEHYHEDGPLFIFINDLAESTTRWIEEGLMVDIAIALRGALVTSDHRYFGLNTPTENITFENLQFLTVDQAVADIAVLITQLREQLEDHRGKVILWGLGYGATLAAMARKKFPHLVDGVWASSGLFRAVVNDESYYENFSNNLLVHGGVACHDRVMNAFDVLDFLMTDGEANYIQERLNLCEPLNTTNTQEDALLIERFVDLISIYIGQQGFSGLNMFCSDLNFFPEDPLNSLVRWVSYVYTQTDCVDVNYESNVARLTNVDNENSFDVRGRAFQYLRCTQMGAFRIGNRNHIIVVPDRLSAEYHIQWCIDIFGEEYNPDALAVAAEQINNQFGNQDNQVITHSLFVNAQLDPWVSHGVTNFNQLESAVFNLQFSPAGNDLRSISVADSFELHNAKTSIVEFITNWVQN